MGSDCISSWSLLIFLLWVKGLHSVDAYSTWGRTRVWYAAVRIAVFLVLMFLFKNPSVLFTFVEILYMWVFQLRSLLMSTPRYLAWSMASSNCPCNMYMCWAGCLDLEMCNTWHLLGLKSMSHRRFHVSRSRSCWRVSESEWLLIVI